jgi:MFS family permease
MGRLADRLGVMAPAILGTLMLGAGYVVAASTTTLWQFLLAQALLIGMLGSSATFGPLVADVSLWFRRRRGIAVAIVASGNYLAGTIWPPALQAAIEAVGWRQAYVGVGVLCVLTMLPLALTLRRRAPVEDAGVPLSARDIADTLRLSPAALQGLLVVAGLACCIAMSMPQVHIVAYCADLGYGPARGAQMLSLMLGLGVVSRLASGVIADRIGGVGTLMAGSTLQCLALLFYLPFDGLASLYVVSALFGLSQGGIVPSYALIVRDYFPAREAGARISLVLMATIVGMAIGGWMSGAIYDLTGSYRAAFLNGIAWNLLNMAIAFWLLLGHLRPRPAPA